MNKKIKPNYFCKKKLIAFFELENFFELKFVIFMNFLVFESWLKNDTNRRKKLIVC